MPASGKWDLTRRLKFQTICVLPTARRNQPQSDTFCECHTDLFRREPNVSSV